MIKNRSLITACGAEISSKEFYLKNGLQQGTVNTSSLFNIFTADVLKSFELNSHPKFKSIAFADDLIVYVVDERPSRIKIELQTLFQKIKIFYNWKLKINTLKCETILFRMSIQFANMNVRKQYTIFRTYDKKVVLRYLIRTL